VKSEKKEKHEGKNKRLIFWCFLFSTSLSTTYSVGKKPRGKIMRDIPGSSSNSSSSSSGNSKKL